MHVYLFHHPLQYATLPLSHTFVTRVEDGLYSFNYTPIILLKGKGFPDIVNPYTGQPGVWNYKSTTLPEKIISDSLVVKPLDGHMVDAIESIRSRNTMNERCRNDMN